MILLVFACTDDFEEMNKKSNAVTEVNPSYFMIEMEQMVFRNYQRNVNLYPDLYSQYFANTITSFSSPRYDYVDGWIGNQWKEHYTELLRRSNAMIEMYSEDPSYQSILAVNDIFTCYWWSRMTDTYGDVPYFGAGLGSVDPVPYNSQQEIYYDLLARLEAACDVLPGDENQLAFDDMYDLIYNSDFEKWRKFGNSLRLRLGMRLSNVDAVKAKAVIADAIADGVMTSNDDVAKVPMWSKGWYDYLHQMLWNWDNQRVSKSFTDHLYNLSSVGEDPRTPLWLTYKSTSYDSDDVDGDGNSVPRTREELDLSEYTGLENGYGPNMPADKNKAATVNLWGGYLDFAGDGANNAMYCPIMFYSEVLFLQAEAVLRGWASGDAGSLLKDGIQASMDYVGVDAEVAGAYIDGLDDLTGSNESKLKTIITHKWVANFPNGVEGWADFRRTDYPDLTLPADGVSGVSTVAANTFVKRISYPTNQHNLNEVSMPASLNTVASDRMDIKVWWDVKGSEDKNTNGLMDSNF